MYMILTANLSVQWDFSLTSNKFLIFNFFPRKIQLEAKIWTAKSAIVWKNFEIVLKIFIDISKKSEIRIPEENSPGDTCSIHTSRVSLRCSNSIVQGFLLFVKSGLTSKTPFVGEYFKIHKSTERLYLHSGNQFPFENRSISDRNRNQKQIAYQYYVICYKLISHLGFYFYRKST